MSELRQDRTTGGWVIIAPKRGGRPQMHEAGARARQRPRFDPACPFCPGNEAQLPGIVAELPARGVPGWRARVVPNKFPAVQLEQTPAALACGGHRARPGRGRHEVIIESPWHDAELATMDAEQLNAAVGVYRDRSRALLGEDDIAAAVLFGNCGISAGASLAHPHAQIIALDFVPPKIAAMNDWAKRYYAEHGRCALCDELADECKSGQRLVEENDAFAVLVPFAAEHPFEMWVVPKRHQPAFDALTDDALPLFAALFGRSLRRLRATLGEPAYNFVVDTAPKSASTAPHWHWRLRIVPDIATWGGFELGAGLPINPSSPEDDARLLRAAAAGP
jgi:UDPglucose--hexose-1-phosphate uridylyltransferase